MLKYFVRRYKVARNDEGFGCVLYVSVGATCVGSILFTSYNGQHIEKGMEHGYMAFGGSTVLAFFPPKAIIFDKHMQNASELLGVPSVNWYLFFVWLFQFLLTL